MSILHRYFHFQHANVGSSLAQKVGEFMESQFHRDGNPDDLTGAPGSFSLYAAPADVKIIYLDYFSREAVISSINDLVQQLNMPSLYGPYPVARGDVRVKGNIYYPVHNKDFRTWAIKHQRGGDFMAFSDRKRCQLRTPIRIKL